MTTATAYMQNPRSTLKDGDILWGWCSKCMTQTEWRYQPYAFTKEQCLSCEQAGRVIVPKAK